MKRVLYISPYFPPQKKVGALRPLKFVRHLPAEGWLPTVLCDARATERLDPSLSELVPPDVEVDPSYGWLDASPRWSRILRPPPGPGKPASSRSETSAVPSARARKPRVVGWNPEWFPWGEHFLDVSHAVASGRRLLQRKSFDAILVNADPYAALEVGRRLAREFSLPWVADLRDPWSVCELRRPLRPALVRRYVDSRERELVASSSKYILNTERAADDYRALFPDLEDRFAAVRNHVDTELFDQDADVEWREFTILFLGTFRRFVSIEPILRAMRLVHERCPRLPFRLRVVGTLTAEEQEHVSRLGTEELVELLPSRPYRQAGSLMQSADLLLSQSHHTDQRIVAKLYDYFSSQRPILHLGVPNDELREMCERAGGVDFCRMEDETDIAAVLQRHLTAGRQRHVDRGVAPWSSRAAAQKLGALLDGARLADQARRA